MKEIVKVESNNLETTNDQIKFVLESIREDLRENPYIEETIRVLPVGGYRSAIGSFWNAVVDDLRNKVIYRSLDLFNKEMHPAKIVKNYEDFQDNVNDEMLIDGAYKIGIIGWEAHKVLKHAKETRHIFDGHPKSTEPTPIKVLSMMEDCIKYVLSQEYPPKIIDVDEYVSLMETNDFDRNEISISAALDDLPEIYTRKLINILFSKYIDINCSSVMRQNIEFVAPVLWNSLTKDCAEQICKRVDTEVSGGDKNKIKNAFEFVKVVKATRYLSSYSRKYLLAPYITKLNNHLDDFVVENECIDFLYNYAGFIPKELIYQYVNGLTQTFVGKIGYSIYFARTDFYADRAATKIPLMFEQFDSYSTNCFLESIRKNIVLKDRISRSNVKLRRLRQLGNILLSICSETYENKSSLLLLVDETKEEEFFKSLK